MRARRFVMAAEHGREMGGANVYDCVDDPSWKKYVLQRSEKRRDITKGQKVLAQWCSGAPDLGCLSPCPRPAIAYSFYI